MQEPTLSVVFAPGVVQVKLIPHYGCAVYTQAANILSNSLYLVDNATSTYLGPVYSRSSVSSLAFFRLCLVLFRRHDQAADLSSWSLGSGNAATSTAMQTCWSQHEKRTRGGCRVNVLDFQKAIRKRIRIVLRCVRSARARDGQTHEPGRCSENGRLERVGHTQGPLHRHDALCAMIRELARPIQNVLGPAT
eukprot:3003057-Rhodomonas_salina.2